MHAKSLSCAVEDLPFLNADFIVLAAGLTTPGAALARLAQAPGRPREIIGYARSAEGIRGRAAGAGPREG